MNVPYLHCLYILDRIQVGNFRRPLHNINIMICKPFSSRVGSMDGCTTLLENRQCWMRVADKCQKKFLQCLIVLRCILFPEKIAIAVWLFSQNAFQIIIEPPQSAGGKKLLFHYLSRFNRLKPVRFIQIKFLFIGKNNTAPFTPCPSSHMAAPLHAGFNIERNQLGSAINLLVLQIGLR